MSFKDLGLSNELLRAITEKKYQHPTSVQKLAIPVVLDGHDMLVCAQTGTGKTAGFTLPMLHRLSARPKNRSPHSIRALILTPTRELAVQVEENVRTYSKYLPFKSTIVFGGVSIYAQIKILRGGVDVLVATPGRLLDLVSQRAVDLSKVEILVLDEADRMLDMGFINDIRKITTYMPANRQNLLFCATFSDEIKRLSETFLKSPKLIEVSHRNTTSAKISQIIYPVDNKRKRELLSFLVSSKNWQQVLVFTRTKHGANRLSEQLVLDGITSTAIHGNKTQAARAKALNDFKKGVVRVLVATDVAARGLDIDQLPQVVNFELPNVPEDYVHRIGRTGRAGHEGAALSLVCVDEHKLLRNIEHLLKCSIVKEIIPGYEPDPSIRAQPIRQGRNFQRNSNQNPHSYSKKHTPPGHKKSGRFRTRAGRP